MLRSSDYYILCPHCHDEIRVRRSGRSHVGKYVEWSDGFSSSHDAGYCRLSACPSCHQSFWLDDVQRTARVPQPTRRDVAYGSAILLATGWHGVSQPFDIEALPDHGEPFALPASNAQFIAALDQDHLTPERQKYLRTQLWWRGNHPYRGGEHGDHGAIPDHIWTSNLAWLLDHFQRQPNDDRDVVIEAELFRALGAFQEAQERMEIAVCAGSTRAVAIHAQATAGNARVCIVREDESSLIY